jgi:hypothetical protein
VYVYHLPPRCGAYWAPYGIDRPVAEMLHERLAASAHRVADGGAAALFYVPLPLRKMQKAVAAGEAALACVAELARAFRHVNATGGGRGHLLVTAADAGPAEAWRATWQAQGLPPAVRGLRSCEMTMPRRCVHACHAGALVHGNHGSFEAKRAALTAAGVTVFASLGELVAGVRARL